MVDKIIKIKQLAEQYKIPVLYSGGSIVKALAQMFVGFIIAKFVAPNDFGLWTSINLAVTYSAFLQAGLINGLNLELPFAYGKGDMTVAEEMAGTVQTFTVISSLLVFIAGLLIFFLYPIYNIKLKYGILAISLFIALNFYMNYLLSTFRSKNSFLKLAYIQFIDAFVNLLTIILVIYFAFYGMLIKSVVVILIYVILLHISRPIKKNLGWNNSSFIKVLKVGLPIYGLVCLDSFSSTVDRLLLLKYSNLTEIGLYSFGLYALTTFTLLSASVASYIYPRMTHSFGKTNDLSIIWQYVRKITLLFFVAQIVIAIIGYFLIPVLVQKYFPSYILSITPMQILLFAGVFKGSIIGVNALWSIKNWKYMVMYQVIYSALLITLTFAGVQFFTNKIEGAASGVLLANVLNFFSGFYLTYLATHSSKIQTTL